MNKFISAYQILIFTLLISLSLNAQNVGIGTTSPMGEFHISEDNQITDPVFLGSGLDDFSVAFGQNVNINAESTYTIRIDNAGPNPNLIDVLEDGIVVLNGIPINIAGYDIGGGIIISFNSPTGHTFGDTWTFSVILGQQDQLIVKDGKVGIGLSDPSEALEVEGDIKFSGSLVGNFASEFLLINRQNRIGVNEMFGIESREGGYGGMFINVEGSNPQPYYGFAVDGNARAWLEYDAATFDVVVDNNAGNFSLRRNTASKPVAGSWAANSDRRLKKNINPLNKEDMLNKLLSMQGVSYEWNDGKTGFRRPAGSQIGFIAQDLEKVWPNKVSKDKQGYLVTAYGDYDPVFVESIKALNSKIERQEKTIQLLVGKIAVMEQKLNASTSSQN